MPMKMTRHMAFHKLVFFIILVLGFYVLSTAKIGIRAIIAV